MIKRFGVNPERAVMVEDMAKNLRPAADMGMTTVWVKTDTDWANEEFDESFIHHIAEDLTDWLGTALLDT
jgi:putative hydrolase of the HAD superfamily